jgi:hypothetical protein
MHKFLKSIRFSFKSRLIHPHITMPSGVLPMAEMRRLVADMVD